MPKLRLITASSDGIRRARRSRFLNFQQITMPYLAARVPSDWHVTHFDEEAEDIDWTNQPTVDAKRHFPSNVRMERFAGLEQMRPLARVHHDHAFRMVDDPRIRGEPSGPVSVGEYPEPSSQAESPPLDLRGLDP